jgi:hypothetical protein
MMNPSSHSASSSSSPTPSSFRHSFNANPYLNKLLGQTKSCQSQATSSPSHSNVIEIELSDDENEEEIPADPTCLEDMEDQEDEADMHNNSSQDGNLDGIEADQHETRESLQTPPIPVDQEQKLEKVVLQQQEQIKSSLPLSESSSDLVDEDAIVDANEGSNSLAEI